MIEYTINSYHLPEEEKYRGTLYGIMNAITRAAQQEKRVEKRQYMESTALKLISSFN